MKVIIPRATLAGALRACLRCIGNDFTRMHLCGVLLESVDGKLRLAATNGHKVISILVDVPCAWPNTVLENHAAEALFKSVRVSASRKNWMDEVVLQHTDGALMSGGVHYETRNLPKFVPVDKTIPPRKRSSGASVVAVNAQYMVEAMRCASDIFVSGVDPAVVDIQIGSSPYEPVRIDCAREVPWVREGRGRDRMMGPWVKMVVAVAPCRR